MVRFTGRMFGHLWLVATEFAYNVIRLRDPVVVALNYAWMRLLTPFGLFRDWDRKRPSGGRRELQELSDRGFSEMDRVDPAQVERLRTFFCERTDLGAGRTYEALSAYFDHYRTEGVQRPRGLLATGADDCEISRMALREDYVALAAEFLGIDRSRIVTSASIDALIRLEQPRAKPAKYDDALEFHRDIDSYRFVKMFVYLTECERNGGHHEVYLHSHRHTPIRLGPIARYTNVEIEETIPEARLHCVEGPAGYAFAENTYALHRGTKPQTGDRLILNLQYMEDTFQRHFSTSFPVSAVG